MAGFEASPREVVTPPLVAPMESRALTLSGRRLRVRLEAMYWEAFEAIAGREGCGVAELAEGIEGRFVESRGRAPGAGAMATAMRGFVVDYFRRAATEIGHAQAGHGRGTALPRPLRLVR